MAFWKSQSNEDAARDVKKEVKKESSERKQVSGRTIASRLGTLLAYRVTEKSAASAHRSTYVFQVAKHATKLQVKAAVEGKYGVNVIKVRVVNLPGKERKRGKQIGWKSGIKKAMVKLKEGETIEAE